MAIPTKTQTNHHVGEVVESISMGFRSEDYEHIAFMLENPYSDPILAVVREYSTNAWDSHVFAGNTAPIEVFLPTDENLEFIVQDYGVGMDIETLRTIFCNYGASDKRGTNAVTGQLGIGSKSGLAYATAFTVSAVKDGIKVVAMLTKDDHGRGVIEVLFADVPTTEPNGVKITIPVESYDVESFRYTAENLYQFWDEGTVLIDGEAPAVPEWKANALSLDEDGHTILISPEADLDSSYVVMGNVPYPVNNISLDRGYVQFVARLNIGDVDFAPSREDVRHTPWTKETLRDLGDYIREARPRAIKRSLGHSATRWEETMLRTLWMDRSLTVKGGGSPIWWFDPSVTWGRKSKSHNYYHMSHLASPKVTVITQFPAQTVSTVARDRLTTFMATKGNTAPTFIIVPKAASVGMLDGRPNTYTWDEIVGATALPKAARKARAAQQETRYSMLSGPSLTAAQLAAVKGTVLYVDSGCHARYGDLGGHPVVFLRSSNQIDRLRRLVPGITPYSDEAERQRKAAAKAITKDDRQIVEARTLPAFFKDLDPAMVDDKELASWIRLSKSADTPAMVEARKWSIHIDAKGQIAGRFSKRYPLLITGYGNRYDTPELRREVLLYINARYAANSAS